MNDTNGVGGDRMCLFYAVNGFWLLITVAAFSYPEKKAVSCWGWCNRCHGCVYLRSTILPVVEGENPGRATRIEKYVLMNISLPHLYLRKQFNFGL